MKAFYFLTKSHNPNARQWYNINFQFSRVFFSDPTTLLPTPLPPKYTPPHSQLLSHSCSKFPSLNKRIGRGTKASCTADSQKPFLKEKENNKWTVDSAFHPHSLNIFFESRPPIRPLIFHFPKTININLPLPTVSRKNDFKLTTLPNSLILQCAIPCSQMDKTILYLEILSLHYLLIIHASFSHLG